LGGEGDDLLVGGAGRDLLIGGIASDRIVGNAEDDVLIGGTTAFDFNDAALAAILGEWTSDHDYTTRVMNLGGIDHDEFDQRLNGDFFLRMEELDGLPVTVFDDEAKDVMTGCAGIDWFLATLETGEINDKVTDLGDEEFAGDLEFILTDAGL